MKLKEASFLFIDCQTTGMHPSRGHLLEIAWAYGSVSEDGLAPTTHLLKLPEGAWVPAKVKELTGLTDQDLLASREPGEVFAEFREFLTTLSGPIVAIIHYAQFERAFLDAFFAAHAAGSPPFEILCSYAVAKKTVPTVPSRNIRALAGFFGAPFLEVKRAASHVEATRRIWAGLVGELERAGIEDVATLKTWLKEKPASRPERFEYRVGKDLRLGLPDQPGIYRMLAKNGEVLYVGKATSLKDRVNSYFRGQKGRDARKKEMISQVWDLDVTTCETPLEAALLEADEIKRLNPPYNVSLKTRSRSLVFYARDLLSLRLAADIEHGLGPFHILGPLEQIRLLAQSLEEGSFYQIFYDPIDSGVLEEGWRLFRNAQGFSEGPLTPRNLLALGMKLHREHLREERRAALEGADVEAPPAAEEFLEDESEPAEEVQLTPEDVAGKFERLLRRGARAYRRARRMTRVLNSDVHYRAGERWRVLRFRDGQRVPAESPHETPAVPWAGLGLSEYDRMTVLLTELIKYEHRIVFL